MSTQNPKDNGAHLPGRPLFESVCNFQQQLAFELFPSMLQRPLSMQTNPQTRSQKLRR
jgi:hypothetical protein